MLTARYPDKAAHDVERAAAIQLLDDVTAIAEKRMAELQQQRKALDTEMEFYQRDPAKAPMPRWPGQIPPPLATPNSPRQDRRIMTTRVRRRCVRRPP